MHRTAARLLRSQGYDATAADVWSFGVTLHALVGGRLPWGQATVQDATFRAFVAATQPHAVSDAALAPDSPLWGAPALPTPWAWPRAFSPALVHLLSGCLAVRKL